MVSSYIFYQNIWFAHIWHTLKSDLVDFSKYGFHQYFKVLVEPAFFFPILGAQNEQIVHRKYRKTSGSKEKKFPAKNVPKLSW